MIKLSPRLSAAASLINKNSRLADIGTDHGYVPVFLVKNGLISCAVASDINEGPLSSCKDLVNECGITNIDCRISNGLEKIGRDEIDDILIAGMGGDLIVAILSACDWVSEKHLVLNPMTHPEIVRKWLYDNGYAIHNDLLVEDSGRVYSVFDATFCGKVEPKQRKDYFLGNITDFSHKSYFLHLLNYLNNKQKGGEDYSDVITAIEEIL